MEIKLFKLACIKCGWKWTPAREKLPVKCPSCQTKKYLKKNDGK
jgi:predicted Zn-ribbon and HTH transcriptional regulator